MFVVAFNGPPGSGKDTAAQMLQDLIESRGHVVPIKQTSLSFPLRRIAYAMCEYKGALDGPDYERFKLMIFPQFSHQTGREILITVSERFLKEQYGQEIMAKLLMAEQRLSGFDGILLIRDSGFQVEVDPIAREVGEDNLLVVQMARPDCDFSNDSREWVTHKQMYLIENDQGLAALRVEVGRIYSRMLNQLGWQF